MICSYHNVVGLKFALEAVALVTRLGRDRQLQLAGFHRG